MPKNLIVCSDGTSNTPETETNVQQFYAALSAKHPDDCFYDSGVGSFSLDWAGKAFGSGLGENIRECYDFIVDRYEPGDRIFLFGFSRGAYTVRSLANFIDLVGLVERNPTRVTVKKKRSRNKIRIKTQQHHALLAYEVYELNRKKRTFASRLKRLKREIPLRSCEIHCIGVWDTVGSVNLPDQPNRNDADKEHRFHRTDLSDNVRYAYQALAIDDERKWFWPNRFDKASSAKQTIEEVWFAGMHSDVGGGYVRSADDPHAKELSNLSLRWMADKMPASLGLKASNFPKGNPLGAMHDSRTGLASRIPRRVRRPPDGSAIHQSVIDRIQGPLENPNETRERNGRYRPAAFTRRGNDPFEPDWDVGPDYGLDSRYTIVA